jgi:hypothetical protein
MSGGYLNQEKTGLTGWILVIDDHLKVVLNVQLWLGRRGVSPILGGRPNRNHILGQTLLSKIGALSLSLRYFLI